MSFFTFTFTFSSLLLFASAIALEDTYFVQPPQEGSSTDYRSNPSYLLNSNVELEWITSMQNYSMYLGQIDLITHEPSMGSPILTRTGETIERGKPRTYTWAVNHQKFDLGQSNVFFFALALNDKLDGVVISHTFNISETPAPQAPSVNPRGTTSSQESDPGADITIRRTLTVTQDSASAITTSTNVLNVNSVSSPVDQFSTTTRKLSTILIGDPKPSATGAAGAPTSATTASLIPDIVSMTSAQSASGTSPRLGSSDATATVTMTMTVTRMFFTVSPSSTATSSPSGSSTKPFSTNAAHSVHQRSLWQIMLPSCIVLLSWLLG